MCAATEETSPVVPKQNQRWRPIEQAAYRWSKSKREREGNGDGGEYKNQSDITPQKSVDFQKQPINSSSVKQSVEREVQGLFNHEYNLKASFEENMRMLNDRKRNKDGNPLSGVSDGCPSHKRRRTPKKSKLRKYQTHENDQPTSKTLQSNMDITHQSVGVSADGKPILAKSPTGTVAKVAGPAFDPPKAPRSHFLLEGSSPRVQSKKTDCDGSHLFQHLSPNNRRGTYGKVVQSHEASLTRNNEVQLFRATDLQGGIFSNRNGRYEVHRGRSQSTIAPDNFYDPARNANQGKSAKCLLPQEEAFSISQASQQSAKTSLSPNRVSRASSTMSDYNPYEIPNAGLGISRRLTGRAEASHVAEQEESPSKANGRITPNEGAADKEAQDVLDWAVRTLEQELASTSSQQSLTRESSPSERNHIEDSPAKPFHSSPGKQRSPMSNKAKRHQSLPARLTTPAPPALKPPQTPADRVKASAREYLAKLPNLSILDIKRVVEELDRRLTDIEADNETSRSMRSNDRPDRVTNSNIVHYSTRDGFTDAPSTSVSRAVANAPALNPTAQPNSGWTPINHPLTNSRGSAADGHAMPPPPLPPKRKTKSIAEQKLQKPELSPDVPQHERLPEPDIIDLGRRKLAYSRHESAPYAFNYRGKLRKEYRYLLTKVGADSKTVWIAEEVARLS